jgi:hypothetical protein
MDSNKRIAAGTNSNQVLCTDIHRASTILPTQRIWTSSMGPKLVFTDEHYDTQTTIDNRYD